MYVKGTSLWDKEDIQYIIDFYSVSTLSDLAYALDKTKNQVTSKVALLQSQGKLGRKNTKGIHIWTAEEEEYILDNYGKTSKSAMLRHLKTTSAQLDSKVILMRQKGIPVPLTRNAALGWTESNLKYLKDHYKNCTRKEIAHELGLRESTVSSKIQKLLLRGELTRKGKGTQKKGGK